MRIQPNDDTAVHPPRTHTIRLRFDDSPEEQAIYSAIKAASERADRRPVSRHIKYILRIALGLRKTNEVTPYIPPSAPRRPRHLHLVAGEASTVKREGNNEDLD